MMPRANSWWVKVSSNPLTGSSYWTRPESSKFQPVDPIPPIPSTFSSAVSEPCML